MDNILKPQQIFNQLQTLTGKLIESGLCDALNFPSKTNGVNGITEIGITGKDYSVFLKNISYAEMYKTALEKKIYHIKMLDGALLTLLYRFSHDQLVSHRLTYFPAPDLIAFQNEPELYQDDLLYADILDRRIVTVPIRFDFDSDASEPLVHPTSHLTLGQYKNCRIPVSSALTPYQFISFIVSNFYHTASSQLCLPLYKERFEESIHPIELETIHIRTPVYSN